MPYDQILIVIGIIRAFITCIGKTPGRFIFVHFHDAHVILIILIIYVIAAGITLRHYDIMPMIRSRTGVASSGSACSGGLRTGQPRCLYVRLVNLTV